MNSIDPKMTVSEILKQYPETLPVFREFGMKCADDSSYAAKTLEDNFIIEKVNFMDLLNRLNKAVNPAKPHLSEPSPVENKIRTTIDDMQIEVDVPPEIGEIVSQHTSVGERIRKKIIFLWGCLGVIILFLVTILFLYISPLAGTCVILAVSFIGFLVFFFKKETVGVVGTKGFVVYKFSKQSQKMISRKFYLFTDAKKLVFPLTESYVNGIYTDTSFKFILSSSNCSYKTSGKFHNLNKEEGKFGWKYPFLIAVENAWTLYLVDSLFQKLKQEGLLHFESGGSWLEFGEPIELGFNYIGYDGLRFNKKDIKKVDYYNGKMYIEHYNYKYGLLNPEGDKMTIRINNMPNQKAFLIFFNHLLN